METWEYATITYLPPKEEDESTEISVRVPGSTRRVYKTDENKKLFDYMNELGSGGWEAVSFVVTPFAHLMFLFKRPIE